MHRYSIVALECAVVSRRPKEKAGEWQQAMLVFEALSEHGILPDPGLLGPTWS